MNRHLATAGKGLAGAGLTGVVLYLVSTATVHERPLWPYWILLAMVAAGLLLYFLGQRTRPGRPGVADEGDAGAAPPEGAGSAQEPPVPQAGPVITGRWRSTNDGSEVPVLMRHLREPITSHPAYMRRLAEGGDAPPSIRIATLVACDPLGTAPATSAIRAAFLGFLNKGSVSALISELTYVGPGAEWKSWGANGRNTFTAILAGEDEEEVPVALVQLRPPVEGTSFAGRDSRMAELLLQVEPRTAGGTVAPAVNLGAWHCRMVQALEAPEAFVDFLTGELGLATSGDPPAQVGIALDAPNAMTELVDIEDLELVPGSSPSTWFMGWAVGGPDGEPATALAREWLTQMCDSTLKLNGYEPVLAAAAHEH